MLPGRSGVRAAEPVNTPGGAVKIERPAGGSGDNLTGGSDGAIFSSDTPAQSGTPAAGVVPGGQTGDQSGDVPGVVSGTIEKVDGNTLTVKTDDGMTATVQISDTTVLQKQVEIKVSELAQGDTVAASGAKNGDTFEATEVRVMQPMQIIRP